MFSRLVIAFLMSIIGSPTASFADETSIEFDGMVLISDNSTVDVTLVHSSEPLKQAKLKLPKSALVFASHYPAEQYKNWPDSMLEDGRIAFAVMSPDGMPLGQLLSKSQNPVSTLRAARKEIVKAYVRVLSGTREPPNYDFLYTPRFSHHQAVEATSEFGLRSIEVLMPKILADGSRDNTRMVSADGKIVYFGEKGIDSFEIAHCSNKFVSAGYLCTYYKSLGQHVDLQVSFVDFRGHGGREFINRQMDLALKSYCTYDINCGWIKP